MVWLSHIHWSVGGGGKEKFHFFQLGIGIGSMCLVMCCADGKVSLGTPWQGQSLPCSQQNHPLPAAIVDDWACFTALTL